MSNTWFWSDPHFGHQRILSLCKRPFASIEEMDSALIDNFNSVVKQGDKVYCLGDFSFSNKEKTQSIFNKLNKCQHHLIEGNHDDKPVSKLAWNWIKPYYEMKELNFKFVLFHYPIQCWNGKYHGSIHLHGHSHGNTPNIDIRRMDVGVDCTEYKPINLDEILEKMKNIPYKQNYESEM